MKIKHYPGKAVDASLSLESNSAMGALYEANWLQAATAAPATAGGISVPVTVPDSAPAPQRSLSRQPSNAGSFLLDGISVLSKYQMTLEKIRQLELEQARDKRGVVHTMKELNGYRPSALQHHKQQLHNGWVEEQPEEIEEEQHAKNSTKAAPTPPAPASVNHYVLDPTERPRLPRPRQQVSVKPPSLRRSQTMLQQLPPSYVTLRASKVKNNNSSSAVWEHQSERVICQQPQRLLLPPTEPPPAPPTQGAKQRAASSNGNSKPLSRSQTSVQRYATIRMPHHSTSLCRATVPRAPASAPVAPAAPARRHSLEQALQGLRLEETRSQHISPTGSSNGSSKDLNGEGFCIPRPRLIVPVHTYARRRRTGNLKEQSTTQQEEEIENSGKSRRGNWVKYMWKVSGKGA